MNPWKKTKLPIMTRLKHKWQGLVSVIEYHWYYNILYKLHLLKRRNYRDEARREVNITAFNHRTFNRSVETNLFQAIVVPKIEEITTIDTDYLYREKDGHEEIVYTLHDHYSARFVMVTHFESIWLKIGGKKYATQDRLPTLRVLSWNDIALKHDGGVEYKTFTYTLEPLRKVRGQHIISDPATISGAELLMCYDTLHRGMYDYVSKITLKDLEV